MVTGIRSYPNCSADARDARSSFPHLNASEHYSTVTEVVQDLCAYEILGQIRMEGHFATLNVPEHLEAPTHKARRSKR